MAFAVVHDVAASWDRYAPVASAVSVPAPGGLLCFAAGPTEEGVRIVAVFTDEDAWHRFQLERLAPAVDALEGPPAPEPAERYLRASYVVVPATDALVR